MPCSYPWVGWVIYLYFILASDWDQAFTQTRINISSDSTSSLAQQSPNKVSCASYHSTIGGQLDIQSIKCCSKETRVYRFSLLAAQCSEGVMNLDRRACLAYIGSCNLIF